MKLKDFCFAADAKFLMPLYVTVASLLWAIRHERRMIAVHVLDMGINDDDWNKIVARWKSLLRLAACADDVVDFCRHKIDKARFDGFMPWHGSVAPYARLMLPELLRDVEWCLYADCDVLFVDSPFALDRFCEKEDVSVLGQKNPIRCNIGEHAWFDRNGLKFNDKNYVCTGFLLMHLKYLRVNDFTTRALAFLSRYRETSSADQAVINYLCADSLQLLPNCWGVFNCEISNESGGAIHYADAVPWKAPAWCGMWLGNNPAISRLWRVFATRIARLDSSEIKYDLRSVIISKCKAFAFRWYLAVARRLRFGNKRLWNVKGSNISGKSVRTYESQLFKGSLDLCNYKNRHSLKSMVARLVWNVVWLLLFRPTPRGALFRLWRIMLLKMFGAKVKWTSNVLPSCRIWQPWKLEMGEYACLGADVDCYSVDKITVGSQATVSQGAKLCCATHDISSNTMELVTRPINIGSSAWVAAWAIIMPGVSVGEGAVIAAGAVVTKSVEPWGVVGGNPAVFIKNRRLTNE